jgi:hypothetical protein
VSSKAYVTLDIAKEEEEEEEDIEGAPSSANIRRRC